MPSKASRNEGNSAPSVVRGSLNNTDLGVRVENDGRINRLTADSLSRPLELPRAEFKRIYPIIAIATALCVLVLFMFNYTVNEDRQQVVEGVEDVINRGVTLDLPVMQDYAGLSNEEILNSFWNSGFVIMDNTSVEDTKVNGFDIYKLASDVTVDEARAAYDQGIDTLSSVEAARIISGSWRYLMSRPDKAEMRLRYVDFAATTPTMAINDALAAQHFDAAEASEPELDSMGNTNVSGHFDKNGVTYEYTVSVCNLSSVYDLDGLPETAQYVGIKVTG